MSTLKQCDNCGSQTKPSPNLEHTIWFTGWHSQVKLLKTNEHHGTFDFCSILCLQVFVAEKINKFIS